MESTIHARLAELETLRGNPAIIYVSMITDDSVRVLYECLRRQGRLKHLDLILSTSGGLVTTAHQLALLLREYTQYLSILVPFRARSAGTLLCLSADELVLGPMAELGPIDSLISKVGAYSPDTPGMISTQDIRAFRRMAEDWFGVNREEDRLQVLALLAQRFFPTALSSAYRFDQLIHQIANELLRYQLPHIEAHARQQIIDQLVGEYYTHDYVISRKEAQELGLQVRFTSQQEEPLLWDLLQLCRAQLTEHPGQAEQEVVSLIASSSFYAREIHCRSDAPSWRRSELQHGEVSEPKKILDIHWEITI